MKNFVLLSISLLFTIGIYSQNRPIPWTEEGVREIAQNASEAQVLMNCSMLTQEGYLYYAEILVDKLLEFQPQSSNYNYRKGFLQLEIRRDFISAIPNFEIAVLNVSSIYDMYSHKEKSAPQDAFYHMAKCYHYDEQLDKAESFYNQFLATTKKQSELIPEAQLRLKQVALARTLMANPVNCKLKNIGPSVNTNYPDYSSVVSFDGSAIYFTSRRPWELGETEKLRDPKLNQYPEDVYVSYIEADSSWSYPSKLEFCLPDRNEATIALSTDEKNIYLYEDITGNGDIYFSNFYNNQFNEIAKLENNEINSPYWETHAMVSHDGTLLVFSSDRPGGYGGRDLYLCKKTDKGWSTPQNLGPEINGPNDEDSPFFSVDNKQLYFASNGDRSIGGFDILIAEVDQNGQFKNAKNLGYPFNSTNDDLYYTTTVDGWRGFLTSYRKDGKGEKDLYEIHNDFLGVKSVSVLKGEVVTTTGELLPDDLIFAAIVECLNCDAGTPNYEIQTRKRDGKFMTGLKPCKSYRLTYIDEKDKKVMGEETFTTTCDEGYHEIYKKLIIDVATRTVVVPTPPADPLEEVIVKDYKNIELKHYFDYNKNKLTVKRGELKDFVKEIEKQLKDGRSSITITITSSASFVPTKTFESNDQLAKLRAENMKFDLLDHFEKSNKYAGKVTISIIQTIVQGPPYEQDGKNKDKYKPYQYVFLKTE